MTVEVLERRQVTLDGDAAVARARHLVQELARQAGLDIYKTTRIVTATSELCRNALQHGGGGTMVLEAISSERRRGLRVVVEDSGPGIADIERALRNGFTTGGGMGLGLGGARRLVDHFDIVRPEAGGLRVTVIKWS